MTISAVVLACRPENIEEVTEQVNALGWAEVHHGDDLGRLVATIEAPDIDESIKRIQQLQALPRIAMAELAAYVTEEDETHPEAQEA